MMGFTIFLNNNAALFVCYFLSYRIHGFRGKPVFNFKENVSVIHVSKAFHIYTPYMAYHIYIVLLIIGGHTYMTVSGRISIIHCQ